MSVQPVDVDPQSEGQHVHCRPRRQLIRKTAYLRYPVGSYGLKMYGRSCRPTGLVVVNVLIDLRFHCELSVVLIGPVFFVVVAA